MTQNTQISQRDHKWPTQSNSNASNVNVTSLGTDLPTIPFTAYAYWSKGKGMTCCHIAVVERSSYAMELKDSKTNGKTTGGGYHIWNI